MLIYCLFTKDHRSKKRASKSMYLMYCLVSLTKVELNIASTVIVLFTLFKKKQCLSSTQTRKVYMHMYIKREY